MIKHNKGYIFAIIYVSFNLVLLFHWHDQNCHKIRFKSEYFRSNAKTFVMRTLYADVKGEHFQNINLHET